MSGTCQLLYAPFGSLSAMSITSDELNFLVYRYLQESGFVHSAFVFACESLVGKATISTADIPPGALINFIQKGLQYVEIERELSENTRDPSGLSLLAGSHDMETEDDQRTSQQGSTFVTAYDVTELKGHDAEVLVCAWNPKCDLLASGAGDATARIWTVPRGASGLPATTEASAEPVVLIHGENPSASENKDVTTLVWRPDGQKLATSSYDGRARIWSVKGQLEHTLECHKGTVFSLKWNPSGNYLLSGSVDKTAVVWDAESGTVMEQLKHHDAPIMDVDWSDDNTFATCSSDKLIYVCKVGSPQPIGKFEGHTDEVNSIRWNTNGQLLASCSDDATAKIWKVGQSSPVQTLNQHSKEIYNIRWSPVEDNVLATASFDSIIKTWDAETGKCLQTFSEHSNSVYSVAFSPDGQYLASGSLDHTLRIWSVKDGKCIKKYKGGGGIYEVNWNCTGDKVAGCFGLPSKSVCIIDFRK